jgi:uncharacterized protein (TIGR02757 family)
MSDHLKDFLDQAVEKYNQPDFISNDPICLPHLFTKKQDIEIIGFWVAILAWGNRTTIIKKGRELLNLMDNSPHDFVLHHQENDLKRFLNFKHRTFNATDTLYFIDFFKRHYQKFDSLERAFIQDIDNEDFMMEKALNSFQKYFCDSIDFPLRTLKHIASPARNSACKRINMFLRWMVRKDDKGVDFGIWENIKPAHLICPCDVHVERLARKFGLITRKSMDWQTALELTENLRKFDPQDPVKYDFALFGLGVDNDIVY